ncbi:hypothetical protein BS78_01G021900 [Paspalum vaginatum]|nr:hypothetical protein BS78_01G021900 [Paspalum vaginatum]
MAPVILRMDVHCRGCASKIRRTIKNVFGVEEVWVSVETGLVVVVGASLDASLIRWRIQSRASTPVTVVSDGTEEPPPQYYAAPPPYCGYGGGGAMVHMGGGGGGPAHLPAAAYGQQQHPYAAAYLLPYVPASHWVPSRQYMPNEAPAYFNDDNPSGCCIV